MTRTKFFASIAATKAENQDLDVLVENVTRQYRQGLLESSKAARILRDAGCFEAEIAGVVA